MGEPKLSEYMRRVKAGQTILVTERGKAIGQIVPVKPTVEERLQGMVEAGLAEWNGRKPESYQPTAVNQGNRQAICQGWVDQEAAHLTSAVSWQEILDTQVTLETYDRELWLAGQEAGLKVWPEGPY